MMQISNIVVMGFGNIGQALSALLRRRFVTQPIHVIDERMQAPQIEIAEHYGMSWQRLRLTRENHQEVLKEHVSTGTLVLNLATSISSHDLIAWTQARDAFYLDTCIDPWEYQDGELDSAVNTNYQMREAVMALQAEQRRQRPQAATAVVAHGANPGLVSLLVKQALLLLAQQHLAAPVAPCSGPEWALLAEQLGVRVIQIAERDSQQTRQPREAGEFVNTWSVAGFVAEALQPIELGWGSHEAAGPLAAEAQAHSGGCQAAVYFKRMGAQARVRSWTPLAGEFVGHLISHNEAISLASFLSVNDHGSLRYRPTVYYAYHPCDQAMESLGLLQDGHRDAITAERVLKHEIESGIDELGVLLVSDRYPSLWYGSQLSIERARELAPHNNATSLQVVGSIMAAVEWINAHPRAGIVESEQMDHEFLIAQARPYWEPLVHVSRDWQPDPARHSGRWTLDEFLV
ncbi:MAG: hypothetical protein RJA44_1115 [Pseudomonadota bacterium]